MSDRYTTSNYVLSFKGWAQCRMATDPDPSNDPRGVSGYTFALPGEPDFTQICHFQNRDGVVHRSHCPEIGVKVCGGTHYKATVEGDCQQKFEHKPEPIDKDHPLFGAEIDLRNDPVFDSRNSTLVYNGYGLVSPFDLQVTAANGLTISRSFYVDPDCPNNDLESIPIDELAPHVVEVSIYNSANLNATTPGSIDILLESGILDPVAYRRLRLEQLERDLSSAKEGSVEQAALKKRIAELRIDSPQNRRTAQMGTKVLVPYNLNSTQANVGGETIENAGDPWSLEMWMGGWDADALSFFVIGTLQIVLTCDPLSP